MTKALDEAVEAAGRLPEEEQDALAAEITRLVREARQRSFEKFLAWVRSDENPFRGKSADMIAFFNADRDEWDFGRERKDP